MLLAFICLWTINSMGTHLVGGEMSYRCLGGNSYEITLKIYRDCAGTGAPFDAFAKVGIFHGVTGIMDTLLNVPLPGVTAVPVNTVSSCLVIPPGLCLQEAIYVDTITLLPDSNGYDIVYQRCCRNPSIVNITTPGSVGNTYHSYIPPLDTACNSSPSFNNFPPVVLCINDPISFDHSATDLDGDSLVYEFVAPYIAGTSLNPAPNPTAPPFSTVNWAVGFNVNNQLTSLPSLALNSSTGLLTGIPTAVGQYIVGITVKEYRNGVLLSETRRDFQFNILNCLKSISSIFDPGTICNSYTVNFVNNSINASAYFWNFGDPTTLADTSVATSPSYTFPDTGVYRVSLIVDPTSTVCADTSFIDVRVYPILEPYFVVPDNQCLKNNSFDFIAAGAFFNTTQIDWDFGLNASLATSNNLSETGVSYSTSGMKYISIRYQDFGCDTTFIDSLEVYPSLKVEFDVVQDSVCIGDSIPTRFSSTSDTSLKFLWSFGDGSSSVQKAPSHLYLAPGSYALSLIVSDANCADTLIKPTGLVVLPSPIAKFSPINSLLPTYASSLIFENESANYFISVFMDGDGGVYSPFTQVSKSYEEEKFYYPMLVVQNTLGCADTLIGQVYVRPEIYVSNSFTPNNDGKNELFLPSVASIIDYEFMIFNRWGDLIFETTDPKQGWDGKSKNGTFLKEDVYVYRIVYKDPSGINKELFGHINLLR